MKVHHATTGHPADVLPLARERMRRLVMTRSYDDAIIAGRDRADGEPFHVLTFDLDDDLLAMSCRSADGWPRCGVYRVPSWRISEDALVNVQAVTPDSSNTAATAAPTN